MSHSTYNWHKQYHTDKLSSQLLHFIVNNSAPSTSNILILSTSIFISPDNATPGIQNTTEDEMTPDNENDIPMTSGFNDNIIETNPSLPVSELIVFHKIQSQEIGINGGGPETSTPNNLGLPTNQSSSVTNVDAEQNMVDMGLQVDDDLKADRDREGIIGRDNLPDPRSQWFNNLALLQDAQKDGAGEETLSDSDIEELCSLAQTEDIKLSLKYIKQLQSASLEDDRMWLDPDVLDRLCNPCEEGIDLSNPNLHLTLNLFLAVGNLSQETYNSVHKAILCHHPEDEVLMYDQIKCCVAQLSGIIPLICKGNLAVSRQSLRLARENPKRIYERGIIHRE